MGNRSNQTYWIVSIISAAVLLSAALVFLGLQMKSPSAQIDEAYLDKRIDAGIDRYIQNQVEKRRQNQAGQPSSTAQNAKKVRPVTSSRDHIYGNPAAIVSLIEYSEFECPFCKRFHPTPSKVVEKYQGKVNWVFRHFPLDIHNPAAQKEAEAAECAGELGGDEAFYKYADLLFDRTRSNGKGVPKPGLSGLAEELGLNKSDFDSCLSSGRFSERVMSDYKEGLSLGISGTPTIVLINNKTGDVKFKAGAYPPEAIAIEVDSLLN